jgi:hypothetical protein
VLHPSILSFFFVFLLFLKMDAKEPCPSDVLMPVKKPQTPQEIAADRAARNDAERKEASEKWKRALQPKIDMVYAAIVAYAEKHKDDRQRVIYTGHQKELRHYYIREQVVKRLEAAGYAPDDEETGGCVKEDGCCSIGCNIICCCQRETHHIRLFRKDGH